MNSMAMHVDMSLDDIIKSRKKSDRERGQGRGRRRRGRGPSGTATSGGRMTGAVRRGPLSTARPSSHTIAKSFRRTRNFPWQRDLFEDSLRAAGISGIEVSTKLYVSNLHPGVTNDDIRELFSEIGELKRYAIHYDKTGRPSGSAEVVYARRSDSFAALKRYNNVLLDGKPMKIEVVGKNAEVPIQARVNVTGINGRRNRTVVMTSGPGHAGGAAAINRGSGSWGSRGGLRNSQGRGRGVGEGRGRGRDWGRGHGRGSGSGSGRGRGRGHVQGNKKPVDKSADELDNELEKYHAEAMQT